MNAKINITPLIFCQIAFFKVIVETMNAAMVASLGCDMTQISLLFFLAYANAAGGNFIHQKN